MLLVNVKLFKNECLVEGLERFGKRFQKRGMLNMKAAFPWKQLSSSNVTETK